PRAYSAVASDRHAARPRGMSASLRKRTRANRTVSLVIRQRPAALIFHERPRSLSEISDKRRELILATGWPTQGGQQPVSLYSQVTFPRTHPIREVCFVVVELSCRLRFSAALH